MAKLKLYTDEHIAQAVVYALRQRHIDVQSAKDARTMWFPDENQLALAHRQGRVLVTRDKDFTRLHAVGSPHSGIAYFPKTAAVGEMIASLALLAQLKTAEELVGCIEYL